MAVERIALEDEAVKAEIAKLKLPEGAVVISDPWIYGELRRSTYVLSDVDIHQALTESTMMSDCISAFSTCATQKTLRKQTRTTTLSLLRYPQSLVQMR